MSQKISKHNKRVYKLVLTGGPCGGKTTGQARLCTFFENLGWKVYRVPEAATVLVGGGVRFGNLDDEETFRFQENLIRTMMQMETTFFDLASTCPQDCLVICDRGAMDASAYLKPEQWERMKEKNGWNNVDLRDNRYNQVIHMVSAAKGAEAFYQLDNNVTRHEGVDVARKLDEITSQAWVGHPYYDVIDNSTDFERKVVRTIAAVCNRLGLDAGDRLAMDSKKRKFLIKCLPDEAQYPKFQDFIVAHDYLVTPTSEMQARIRRRGQNVSKLKNGRWNMESGNWTYTHTIRRPKINEEAPEMKMQITTREYELLLAQRDTLHYSIYKKRRCFLWHNQYFQLDIYEDPCPEPCRGLIILETYTTLRGDELMLPDFLEIDHEITDDSSYSMFNLSKKPESLIKNRVRSYSEGESIGAGKRAHQKRIQSVQCNQGSLLENGPLYNGGEHAIMNGSASDVTFSSGESS